MDNEKEIKDVANKKCSNCGEITPNHTGICNACGSVDFVTLDNKRHVETYEEGVDEKEIAEKVEEKKNINSSEPVSEKSNPTSAEKKEETKPEELTQMSKKLEKQLKKRKKINDKVLEKRAKNFAAGKVKKNKVRKK